MHCKNIWIHYKLAVMAYKVLHGRAPSYFGPLVRVADVSGRRALRSAGTNRILVPPVMSTAVGSQAFAVAAPLIWNSLPDDVISAESLPTFQRKLKRHLFCQSFPVFPRPNSSFHPFGVSKLSSEQLYRIIGCVPVTPSGECSRG